MNRKMSPAFCIMLWIQLVTGETGEFHVCTHSRMHSIGEEMPVPFTIENPGDFERARYSEFLRNLRIEMLNGLRLKMCGPFKFCS
jgi:hypothetical protein